MTPIEQAIEALELAIETSYSESTNVTFNAAISALRGVEQKPGDKQQEIDTITELNHAQWLALGKASLLVAACNRLLGEAEEFDFDDGLGRGAPQAYWDEFEDALEQAAEAIDVANKTIYQNHISTPPPAPVLLTEAERLSEAWPADLSSAQRTQAVRFGVCDNLAIDDDDFRFDALIVVHGDFGEGEKAKYVAEVCRRLNGAAALSGDTGAES